MYNLDILLKLKELNISLEKYILLKIIEDCSLSFFKQDYLELLVTLKIEGFVNAELELTKKGIELLQSIENQKVKSVNFNELHELCKEELKRLTGKSQYMVAKKYAFINNQVDFNNKLKSVCVKYKLKDINRIKELLLLHINKAVEAKFEFTQLLGYYISKENKSTLADDYYSDIDTNIEEKKNNNQTNVFNL